MVRAGAATHAFIYRRGVARKMGQVQTVLLTTRGRKSGQPHTVPLGAIPEGDGWVVIGSNSGKDVDPGWWLNLKADPNATVQVNDHVMTMRMREITDAAERERLWNAVVAQGKGYARYPTKTSRVIPLGLLRPVS
jgi:F420H(2)-dependent quinone reductase